jgi:Cadherin-like/Cadherin domain
MRRNRVLLIIAIVLSMSATIFWLGNVLADATVINNEGLTVSEGGSSLITNTLLLSDDPDVSGEILTYTLLTIPANGELRLSGVSLAISDTFRQADIDANSLDYVHDDSETLSDGFDFTVETSTTVTQSTFLITVTPVYDQIPVVDDQIFSVDENTATGSPVDTIIATDLDAADSLTYTIIGGNIGSPFTVVSTTGDVTVDSPTRLDFETYQSLTFTVQVEDLGALTDTAVITVNINDVNEAPTISGGPFTITENAAVSTYVGTVITDDVDANDTFTYTIIVSDSNAFAIGSSNGDITVNDSNLLNFETTPTFTLTVEIEDSGTLTDTADIIINLLDENDAPVLSPAGPFDLPENSPNDTSVGTPITATDDDLGAGDVLTYTITASDPGDAFGINASSGQITVTNSSLLNFETTPTYTLTVQVEDSGLLTDTADVVINLLDQNDAPVLAAAGPFDLLENSPDNTPVGTPITATDDDLLGAGDVLTYTITAGDPDSAFGIGASSGQITVANGGLLDYETPPTSYDLTIQVVDSAGATDSEIVTINVTNANELPTINDDVFDINENSPDAMEVGIVTASDPDAADNNALVFEILSGNTNGAFAITNDGSNNGRITVANSNQLDFEINQSFTLGIIVTDTGGLEATANVTININNLFDETPTVSDATFFVAEGSADGVVVGTVSATDSELGSGDELTFSISSGNSGTVFAIDSSSGQITVPDSSKLDANTMPTFNLTIQVIDKGGNLDTGIITINVSPLPITYLYLPIMLNNYPPIEPNNNCSQSYSLSAGIDYEFTADDTEDWYAITLNSTGNLTIVLSSFEPAQGQLIIYGDSCSNLILLQNNGDPSTTKIINLGTQPAGTYYIRVYTQPITNTTYTLRVN